MYQIFLVALIATCMASNDRLQSAIENIGDIKSIEFSGSCAHFWLGQGVSPAAASLRSDLKSVTQTIDYDNSAWRNKGVGTQRIWPIQFLKGEKAWDQFGNNTIQVSASEVLDRRMQIWLTPHGFLKGALANKATVKNGKVTYTTPTGHKMIGALSADHLVERVETWVDNEVLGDTHVEVVYSDYKDFGGFKFPTRIVRKQGSHPVLDLTVTDAKSNLSMDITAPAGTPPMVQVRSEKLADGTWYLTGGRHHSVALEFADHLVVIEAPLNEERSNAVIAEVKKLVPGKPIRYLINTHHHFDHSGGLRAYVAEGATIITHEINKPFYERTLRAPRTINPDRLARTKRAPRLSPVGAKRVMADKTRTIELHHLKDNPHDKGIIVVYVPKEKMLIEVDAYTPLAVGDPPPAVPPPPAVNLYENIERLKLDVDRIAPLHGRIVSLEDLKKTIGK
jgi:glyoxylase-like metal-dependent hydrolase (beta-lactamase superfamily II)